MNRKLVLQSIIIAFLLLFISLSGCTDSDDEEDDWIIRKDVVLKNESKSVYGNVIIDPGATLELENVILTIESTESNYHSIDAKGTLIMRNSTIKAKNIDIGYGFISSGRLIAENCDISGIGKADYPYNLASGLVIGGTSCSISFSGDEIVWESVADEPIDIIKNCKIHDCLDEAITVASSITLKTNLYHPAASISPIIDGTEIYNCPTGIKTVKSGYPIITNCTIHDCTTGVRYDQMGSCPDNFAVENSTFYNNDQGIYLDAWSAKVINNEFRNNDIAIWDGSKNKRSYQVQVISGNHFKDNVEAIGGGGYDSYISQCSFDSNVYGASLGYNTTLIDCNFNNNNESITCSRSYAKIIKCIINSIERDIMIYNNSHPTAVNSTINLERVYWSYRGEWAEFNATLTVDGEVIAPVEERSIYLGPYEPEWGD